ncbi:Ribosomal silencing factor RsfS [Novipirellula aureliae]|uniref:Ribosomal silencing factor RsfS n=1 Tax=Novipirellula aureliae TaxID=2527966 RepID=A0A5C6DQ52_9BACT|nr:ribosome silencing factor [Novipirellula aureliae]TWU37781.1 Ribosomal silencing factor RsfS [Novipirellula aureliae]
MTEQTNEQDMSPSTAAETKPDTPKPAAVKDPMVTASRAIRHQGTEYSRKLAAAAAQVALDNKGEDVMVLDICGQTAEFDLFVLATGSSRRQLHAISEQIDDVLEKEMGDRRMGIEGYQESRWIVLDYGSVVVHLFDEDTREYYDLETLWADGKRIPLDELGVKGVEG